MGLVVVGGNLTIYSLPNMSQTQSQLLAYIHTHANSLEVAESPITKPFIREGTLLSLYMGFFLLLVQAEPTPGRGIA